MNQIRVQNKEERLLGSLTEFFNKTDNTLPNGNTHSSPKNVEIIKPIINGETISLRILDWFVTNYSKAHNTTILQKDISVSTMENGGKTTRIQPKRFNVWTEYKSQLKLFSKEAFDPFCRISGNQRNPKRKQKKSRQLIQFYYSTDDYLETTLGQLNFFRWVITNGILEYISEHQDEIENDMIETHKRTKANGVKVTKNVGTSKSKQKMTIAAARTFTDRTTKILVSFE